MHSPYIFTLDCRSTKPEAAYAAWAARFVVEASRIESAYRTYCNFAWQTGDFPHFYAAIIASLSEGHDNVTLVISAEEAVGKDIISDLWFALGSYCRANKKHVSVVMFEHMGKEAKTKWEQVLGVPKVFGPMDATEHASGFVKRMQPGDTFTPAWAGLIRGGDDGLFKAYGKACQAFAASFFSPSSGFDKEAFSGTSKFVCIWDRTVSLTGANPQYNSTVEGNDQLCRYLLDAVPGLNAVLLVGTGFSNGTRSLSKVFDMGGFWSKLRGINGRMQQNGFFDYMTAMYDCDVVHVGMKSGGMDALGLLGQKVVFIDSKRAPEITRERVDLFRAHHFRSVAVAELPSPVGKAIDQIREDKGDTSVIKSTIPSSLLDEVSTKAKSKTSGFIDTDLDDVATQVKMLFAR
ncbi:hypothetical protein PO883_00300 [Massilia sp. DJPM01]|uniref:hypothetical protein n=1 Tax=Massilia sp. DJPM01 TaxID=3024404 RepID=UPI00259F0469|nr:hypothetical protein [Massilia sp. DJPM01]MDM5175651.1 hypothetical protein [Massilia sp. DJPM01]